MTCIVGIVEKGKVYIGGDSAGTNDQGKVTIRKDSKVFRVKDFVIGCTTSFRMIQILQFSFKPPAIKKGQDVFAYMCSNFIDTVRRSFKKGGYCATDGSIEIGGDFLVGYKGRLFHIAADFQVSEPASNYTTCGIGSPYALGALYIINDKTSPIEKINKSLEAAVHFSDSIRPPFTILSV